MMQSKFNKFRHELKYQITDAQVAMLQNRIRHLIPMDSHVGQAGTYRIRSLYFDDYEDRCLRENEDGTDPREKFRIRIYNASSQRITSIPWRFSKTVRNFLQRLTDGACVWLRRKSGSKKA